jgi:glycogen synthase
MYIATSRYEPFGLAPLEAALSRCAIVASDIPSFREIWGDTAIYFRSNDEHDIERVLNELSSDPELRATYGKVAYERARQRFTADRMVEDYLNLYRAMVPMGATAS